MKYIYMILTLILVIAIGYISFGAKNNKSGKANRIACHEKFVVFEKVYNDTLLEKVQSALQSGEYTLTSSVQKSVHMKTRLFEYVDLKDVDKHVVSTIAKYHTLNSQEENKVAIDYYIYENDKADPGKKTAKSKLYTGYLHFTFSIQGKKIYAVQVDFMDLKGTDINQSVNCAIKSIVTLS